MITNRLRIEKLDLPLIICYLFLILAGWLNIYSAVYTEEHTSIFDVSQRYGMQFIWMIASLITAGLIIFVINPRIYNVLSPIAYLGVLLLLLLVIFMGKEVSGSKSWLVLGPIRFQPAEISKISTSLFLSYVMSKYGFRLQNIRNSLSTALIILLPMALIILEKETGSALVYCGFIFLLYREGLSGWFLVFGISAILLFVITLGISSLVAVILLFGITGIIAGIIRRDLFRHLLFLILFIPPLAFIPKIQELQFFHLLAGFKPEHLAILLMIPFIFWSLITGIRKKNRYIKPLFLSFVCSALLIFSVDFIFNNILQPHQQTRIENLLGITEDLKGAGYNVHQSKIAIGSGGVFGKGFLKGTQTKFNFVPEQSTDFIFCTIGEEWGFTGSVLIISIYLFLIARILILSERQKDNFTRLYGYCIASCFFMHVFINIGMTMGLLPVIGIPLPYLSYGGSSLLAFTILLFIFIRLDNERWK